MYRAFSSTVIRKKVSLYVVTHLKLYHYMPTAGTVALRLPRDLVLCTALCYGHGPIGFTCLQGGAFSVLASIMFYNTDLQKDLENNLVVIQFRLAFSFRACKDL